MQCANLHPARKILNSVLYWILTIIKHFFFVFDKSLFGRISFVYHSPIMQIFLFPKPFLLLKIFVVFSFDLCFSANSIVLHNSIDSFIDIQKYFNKSQTIFYDHFYPDILIQSQDQSMYIAYHIMSYHNINIHNTHSRFICNC